jgi:ABC-type iron transport system FetAB permease component
MMFVFNIDSLQVNKYLYLSVIRSFVPFILVNFELGYILAVTDYVFE